MANPHPQSLKPSPESKYYCIRGKDVLQKFLKEDENINVLAMDGKAFASWVTSFYKRTLTRDATFRQRVQILELRRLHQHKLEELEDRLQQAKSAYASSPQHSQLEALTQRAEKSTLAVKGLSSFLVHSGDSAIETLDQEHLEAQNGDLEVAPVEGRVGVEFVEKSAELEAKKARKVDQARAKLAEAIVCLERQEAERDKLRAGTPEWQNLQEAMEALHTLEEEISLHTAYEVLQNVCRSSGQATSAGGRSLESISTLVLQRELLPDLQRALPAELASRVQVLSNLTLGLALGEIDKAIVVTGESPAEPVQVLAVVECKRNVNDVGHGFTVLQSVLSWLTCEQGHPSAYDPNTFRTRQFPKGHFDRPTQHEEGGQVYTFGPGSFAGLKRDCKTGYFLEGLYFLTMLGQLTGLSSRMTNLLAHKISTDLDYQEAARDGQVEQLEKLLSWLRSLRTEIETADVLSQYLAVEECAANILFVDNDKGPQQGPTRCEEACQSKAIDGNQTDHG